MNKFDERKKSFEQKYAKDQELQFKVSARSNKYLGQWVCSLLGKKEEILVEGYQRDRWRGRTRTNKLVFFEDDRVWAGNLVDVEINWAGPWFMVGKLARTD